MTLLFPPCCALHRHLALALALSLGWPQALARALARARPLCQHLAPASCRAHGCRRDWLQSWLGRPHGWPQSGPSW